jgi:hypothetical protein
MNEHSEHPPVVYRVRAGKYQFTCRGHLVWEGGIVYAIGESAEGDGFVPEKVRLEESDLELRHDGELGRDWYQYHGFVVVPDIGF